MNNIVIGKRVKVGAAITSTAGVIANFFPEQAGSIIMAAVPITFIVQVAIAKYLGVTNATSSEG